MSGLNPRITVEPGKMGGKPCIRGLRFTVYDLASYLAAGMTEAEILRDFPYLEKEDFRAVYEFFADDRIVHRRPDNLCPVGRLLNHRWRFSTHDRSDQRVAFQ